MKGFGVALKMCPIVTVVRMHKICFIQEWNVTLVCRTPHDLQSEVIPNTLIRL